MLENVHISKYIASMFMTSVRNRNSDCRLASFVFKQNSTMGIHCIEVRKERGLVTFMVG